MSAPREMARIHAGSADIPEHTDLLVIGLGVTGAGVALDAVTRGLRVVAVDAFDVAWGTSRFSSKLVHGGLRYLASAQFGVAHESAVERGILMERTAPHLVHPLPFVIPLTPEVSRGQGALARAATHAGDLLRLGAHTSREALPRPRRIGATETIALAPAVRRDGLRGGILTWDGQLEDDARLVLTIARTAAAYGASLHTHTRVVDVDATHDRGTGAGHTVQLRDELTGATHIIRARSVVNATGVWAGTLDPAIRLKPSRGTHLVVRRSSLPHVRCGIMAPVPGHTNRFVFALPQTDDTFYIGLTDEEVGGPVPDVAEAPEEDVRFLLEVFNRALAIPLTCDDVVGTYAGLRPLLQAEGSSADISRRHAVLVSATGMVTIVGGKLTTYRRMAEDAVDRAVELDGLDAAACRTRDLPLLGAGSPEALTRTGAPDRLVRRYGVEAPAVLEATRKTTGLTEAELLEPVSATVPTTLAELVFGVTHEGAADIADLLDRRTRVGLIPVDRATAEPLATRALAAVSR